MGTGIDAHEHVDFRQKVVHIHVAIAAAWFYVAIGKHFRIRERSKDIKDIVNVTNARDAGHVAVSAAGTATRRTGAKRGTPRIGAVRLVVAVIVHAVTAHLHLAGVDRRIGVVAVGFIPPGAGDRARRDAWRYACDASS